MTGSRWQWGAAWLLVVGCAALLLGQRWSGSVVTWQSLLAPLSVGAPLPSGFVVKEIRRGPRHDVVVAIERPADGATVEVHIAARGRWPNVIDTTSFGVGYESNHSSAGERAEITAAVAEALRKNDFGLPAPDAIPLVEGEDPDLPPWWLESLRGWRGVLLGISLVVVSQTPFLPAGWLYVAGGLGVVDVAAALHMPVGDPQQYGDWILPSAALLLVGLLWRWRGRAPCGWLLPLTLFALGLRLGLGAWGPLHVNGMAPFWIAGAAHDPAAIAAYGPGYRELFGRVAALAGVQADFAIFAANACLSALSVTCVFLQARLLGVGVTPALVAGLLLAVDPVSIRMAATEVYFPSIILLCSLAGVVLLIATQQRVASLGVIAASLLLSQAARIHPCAWGVVAIVPVVLLAHPGKRIVDRWRLLSTTLLAVMGTLMASSGSVLLDVLGNIRGGMLMLSPVRPSLLPVAATVVAAVVYARVASHPRLAWMAAAALTALFLSRQGYGQSLLWQQCYDRLYFTWSVLAAAALLPEAIGRQRRFWLPGLSVMALLWWFYAWPIVRDRTTDHEEYHWVREQMMSLPASCRVIYLSSVEKRGIVLPGYVRPAGAATVAMHPHEPRTVADALGPTPCLYYVHTSICASREGRPQCDAIEARLGLEVRSRVLLAAHPSSPFLEYDRDPVEMFLATVHQVDGMPVAQLP